MEGSAGDLPHGVSLIQLTLIHTGGNPGATLWSISHIYRPILVAFVWGLTHETINLPLGCLQSRYYYAPCPVSASVWKAPQATWGQSLMNEAPLYVNETPLYVPDIARAQ